MNNENGNKAEAVPEVERAVAAETPLPTPVCPYCSADPLLILARTFNLGRFKFMIPLCRACRKAVPAVLFDVAQPLIQQAPGPIVHP